MSDKFYLVLILIHILCHGKVIHFDTVIGVVGTRLISQLRTIPCHLTESETFCKCSHQYKACAYIICKDIILKLLDL